MLFLPMVKKRLSEKLNGCHKETCGRSDQLSLDITGLTDTNLEQMRGKYCRLVYSFRTGKLYKSEFEMAKMESAY